MSADKTIEEIKVGIADWKVAREPMRMITLGLGSCVGIALWDPYEKIGGLAHIMLPDSRQFSDKSKPAKYADLAIPDMLAEMLRRGARRNAITAKIAGGAQMFSFPNGTLNTMKIGERNTEAVKRILGELKIRIVAEDTGGSFGRTIYFSTVDGQLLIKTINKGERII